MIVLSRFTSYMPPNGIHMNDWNHLQESTLADPLIDHAGLIETILGTEIYARIIEGGIQKGPPVTSSAQYPSLGWIVSRLFPMKSPYSHKTVIEI